MEKIKPQHPSFAGMALITVIVGLSGCEFLQRPEDTASAMPSTSTQVSYHQQSKQLPPQQSSDRRKLEVAQKDEDTSLRRDPHPGWGPVNFLW
jgi:hypothetical protein